MISHDLSFQVCGIHVGNNNMSLVAPFIHCMEKFVPEIAYLGYVRTSFTLRIIVFYTFPNFVSWKLAIIWKVLVGISNDLFEFKSKTHK